MVTLVILDLAALVVLEQTEILDIPVLVAGRDYRVGAEYRDFLATAGTLLIADIRGLVASPDFQAHRVSPVIAEYQAGRDLVAIAGIPGYPVGRALAVIVDIPEQAGGQEFRGGVGYQGFPDIAEPPAGVEFQGGREYPAIQDIAGLAAGQDIVDFRGSPAIVDIRAIVE